MIWNESINDSQIIRNPTPKRDLGHPTGWQPHGAYHTGEAPGSARSSSLSLYVSFRDNTDHVQPPQGHVTHQTINQAWTLVMESCVWKMEDALDLLCKML